MTKPPRSEAPTQLVRAGSRRTLVRSFVASAVASVLTRPARSASSRKYRIGVLGIDTRDEQYDEWKEFVAELARRGYVEGDTLVFERRYFGQDPSRLDALASELVAMQPDLIFAFGGTIAAQAAKKATSTIPIVFYGSADPVRYGLVESLGRPGGNVTGQSSLAIETSVKRFEALVEAVGRGGVVAVVQPSWFRSTPSYETEWAALTAAGLQVATRVEFIDADTLDQLEQVLERLARRRVAGVIFPENESWLHDRPHIAAMFNRHRLPAISDYPDYVRVGMLLGYSLNRIDFSRKAADYVDRILRGARPAELPVQQIMTWQLYINMTTAKTLGIAIPKSLLARANELIE